MTRVLLLSDSHGNVRNMMLAVEESKPDLILHMGDCYKDAGALQEEYPDIPMKRVLGNCDWDDGPAEELFELEGKKIWICHGHAYCVKSSLLSLQYAAREKGADIVIFGHTHHLFYDAYDGLFVINPGSIGAPPPGIPASYALLTLEEEKKGLPTLETFYLNENEW